MGQEDVKGTTLPAIPAPRAQTEPLPAPRPPAAPVAPIKLAHGTGAHVRLETSPDDVTAQLRDLEDRLSRCLATLQMHFQPIVHASTRARFGYEALLRSTDRALPHPGAILDAAERLEKVSALGRAVRAKTAKVLANAPARRGLVFVNLHLLDLFDKQLSSPFSPLSKVASRVVLEITERTPLEGGDDLRYRVAELRELGFRIAIDDLGGGHARMKTFRPHDIDFVKLDMSLVRDIDKHAGKERLVRSLIELCHAQGAQVIGEGVETEAEARVLVAAQCDLLQGYLIAKPALPFADAL